MLTERQFSDLIDTINTLVANGRLNGEADALLRDISTSAELVKLIDAVDPSIDSARLLYRAALRVGGSAVHDARWLLAGAFSLEGLDDVAHAIEPLQRITGMIRRSDAPKPGN